MKHLHYLVTCALVAALLLTLCACEQGKGNAPASSVTIPSSLPVSSASSGTALSDGTTTQTFTFRVNANMPQYKCTATVAYDRAGQFNKITSIVITDASSGKLIEIITPPLNIKFTKAAFFTDVNFDGNLDVVIPLDCSGTGGVRLGAYLWNSATEQFVESPSFENILNPAIDSASKQVLSACSNSSVSMSYIVYSFENGQFVQTNEFSWDTALDDPNPPKNADSLMHFTETKGDIDHQIIINNFYISGAQSFDDFPQYTQLQPYYAQGSFWDIGSQKWRCTFANVRN